MLKERLNISLGERASKALAQIVVGVGISRTAAIELALLQYADAMIDAGPPPWEENGRQIKPLTVERAQKAVERRFCEHGAAPGLCRVAKCRGT